MDLNAIERTLTSGPFGDSASLAANSRIYYEGLNALVADVLPDTAPTWPWPGSPQGTAAARAGLDEVYATLRSDPERAPEVARVLARRLDEATSHEQDMLAPEGATRPPVLTAWGDNPLGTWIIDSFHETTTRDGYSSHITPREPTGAESAAVDAALDVLENALPVVSPSTTALVSGIVLFEGNLGSATVASVPTMIFVGTDTLGDPLRGADAILHEGLHQKLNEIELTRQVLSPTYVEERSHRVDVPWGGQGRTFTIDRCLAAYHVYVHLAALHLAVTPESTGLEPDVIAERLAIRWGRANHFARALATPEAAVELGPDGRVFVAWLRDVVDELGTARAAGERSLADIAVVG